MELALALPGVITTCLLIWMLKVVLDRQNEERAQHRIEVDALGTAHRDQTLNLIEIHRREVATLCQRIQAPQVAVAQHLPQDLGSDPPQPDIEDDLSLLAERKRDLDRLEAELQIRAEELATEPFGPDYGRDSVIVP